MFASFMEENNIRWGELIGGLLIIGCSTALVISFWTGITERPWLQFSVFTAVTAALFGLGLYTEHRWKLPNTSRGILLISTLLVPLNFLAFAALSVGVFPGALTFAAEATAFALFTYLVWQSAKVIAPAWPQLLTMGVCAQSAVLLLLGCLNLRLASVHAHMLLAIVPLAAYESVSAWMLARARRWRTVHTHGANAIFLLLGVLTFATALALGLVIFRSEDIAATLRRLALPLSLGGLPMLASGMFLWRRISGRRMATIRTAGTSLAIFGGMILVAGIAVAWPDPYEMLPVAVCDFIALSAIAFLWDVPAANWLALPCAVAAWLTAFHILRGDIVRGGDVEQMAGAMLNASSGSALAPLALLLGAAWKFLGARRSADARVYAHVGLAAAVASIIFVSCAGFARAPDLYGATWIYAVFAVASFMLALRMGRAPFAAAAWTLLAAALVQAFVSHQLTAVPWPDALLTAATLATLFVATIAGRGARPARILEFPARCLVLLAPCLAITFGVLGLSYGTAGRASATFCWAGALFLATAIAEENPALFVAGQTVLGGAVLLLVVWRLALHDWFRLSPQPMGEPWTIKIESCALACVCVFWKLLRVTTGATGPWGAAAISAEGRLNGGDSRSPQDLSPQSPPLFTEKSEPEAIRLSFGKRFVKVLSAAAPFDHTLSAALLLAALGLAFHAIVPAVALELAPRGAIDFGVWRQHPVGPGSLLLVVLLVLIFGVDLVGSALRTQSAAGALTGGLENLDSAGEGTGGTVRIARGHLGAFDAPTLMAFMTAIWIACPLLAARMADSGAAASFLRWLCAAYFLLGSVWRWAWDLRPRAAASSNKLTSHRPLAPFARATLLILGAGPVFALTLWPTVLAITGDSFTAPASSSFFSHIGLSFSYAIPLLIVALTMVGDAITGRSQTDALAASFVFCFTFSLGYLLHLAIANHALDGGDAVRLLQINGLTMAGFALAWLAARELLRRLHFNTGELPGALKLQVNLALTLSAIFLVPSAACLALWPAWAATFVGLAGGPWGLAALFAAVGAGVATGALRREQVTVRALAFAALAVAAMAALSFANLWPARAWDAFHTLLAANTLAAYGLVAFGWWTMRRAGASAVLAESSPAQSPDGSPVLSYQRTDASAVQSPVYFGGENVRQAVIRSALSVGWLVAALAVRALFGDPAAPWWSMGAGVALSFLCILIACWAAAPAALYPAAVLLNFAAATWFLYRGWNAGWSGLDFVSSQIIVAALPGIAWLVLELHVFRPRAINGPHMSPMHDVAAIACTGLALWMTKSIVGSSLAGEIATYQPLLAAGALFGAIALMFACLWDGRGRYAMMGLYVLIGAAICWALTRAGLSTEWLPWALVTAVAAYALFTAILFAHAEWLEKTAAGLGVPPYVTLAAFWLPPANGILAAIVIVAACWADALPVPPGARQIVATAALLQGVALGLLARRSKWPLLRFAAFWVLAGGVVLWGWSWLPDGLDDLLHHWAIALVITACFAHLPFLLRKRVIQPDERWRLTIVRSAAAMLRISAVMLAGTLAAEAVSPSKHPAARFHGVALAVGLTIVIACVLALATALRTGGILSDRRRMGWVYTAEVLLAIAFVHLRLSEPQLFGGLLRPYWPLVIMAIAFIGVGAAALLRRQQPILSEPLARTGIFLPLLPVIGWWLAPAAGVGYGPLLLVVAAFYAVLAGARRSLIFAALAALAANAAMWDALAHSQTLGFFQHPQLWLIPACFCALAGAHLNRDRLTPDRLRTIRYACLVLIYVSSTADVFLNGVDRAPWLPLVLAALSVGGALLGVLLRIRAFLFLGMSFLLLSVVTMIYFASSQYHWTWIWYVAGILLGTFIIAMFALFEKKREQMLALLEGLKRWE
jgi:hypothetical protein